MGYRTLSIPNVARSYPGYMHVRPVTIVYVLALIVTVVSVDLVFFRNHIWARLLVNIGLVLVFLAFFLRFRGTLAG